LKDDKKKSKNATKTKRGAARVLGDKKGGGARDHLVVKKSIAKDSKNLNSRQRVKNQGLKTSPGGELRKNLMAPNGKGGEKRDDTMGQGGTKCRGSFTEQREFTLTRLGKKDMKKNTKKGGGGGKTRRKVKGVRVSSEGKQKGM